VRIPGKPNEMLLQGKVEGEDQPWAIEIFAHGSTTAFADLAGGACEIGMSSRRIKSRETAELSRLGNMTSPACEHVLALDGIAVIVNPNNPVKVLSKSTISHIFCGDITNWAQVGAPPGDIHLYSRDDNSGTFDTFKNLVLNARELAKTARRFENNEQLCMSVANDRLGIGFLSITYVKNVRALAVSDGPRQVTPTPFSIATEEYPLTRRLYLYTSEKTDNAQVYAFLAFVMSREGQAIADRIGFIGQNLTVQSTSPQQPARLNFTLHFAAGRTTLDSKSAGDCARLVDFLQQPAHDQSTVILNGYCDDSGTAADQLRISQKRAAAVAVRLRRQNITRIETNGYGAANPVAVNNTPEERSRNDRVEVWLK
jgi:phosphate transport system substrate-binding protein